MTLSDEIFVSWSRICVEVAGKPLPINSIEMGVVSYVVRDCDPPLTLSDGDNVRQVSLAYNYEEYSHEFRA
jgi:hypothetical protein